MGDTSSKGFASMDEEKQGQISNKSGYASHGGQSSKASDDTSGSKGGQTSSSGRGFASMDPDEQREIASEGGSAPHPHGRGLQNVSKEEREEIARKGGQA